MKTEPKPISIRPEVATRCTGPIKHYAWNSRSSGHCGFTFSGDY